MIWSRMSRTAPPHALSCPHHIMLQQVKACPYSPQYDDRRQTGMVARAGSQLATPANAQVAPAPPLRGLIAAYHGYQHEDLPPGHHRGMPSPYLTLIVTLDDPLVIARHPDPRASPGEYLTLAGGLHTAPALISFDGRMSGVQLAVSPLAARPLFGLPAGELANVDVEATELLGATAMELHERIREAPEWQARFEIMDSLLLAGADP